MRQVQNKQKKVPHCYLDDFEMPCAEEILGAKESCLWQMVWPEGQAVGCAVDFPCLRHQISWKLSPHVQEPAELGTLHLIL